MPRPTHSYADELRSALGRGVVGVGERELARATKALVARYRATTPGATPILSTPVHVAACSAYRMPATHAALARVLADVAAAGLEPRTMLDLGGGTGAAAGVGGRWAHARRPRDRVVRAERVRRVWSRRLVSDAMARGRAVVVAEPGTPDGWTRVLAVRDAFVAEGWSLLGPCPHAMACPLVAPDWCHFGARVNRSAEHRRVKGADLPYEDEKYAWWRRPRRVPSRARPGQARILRRPLRRKGRVELTLCRPDGMAGREVVSTRPVRRRRRGGRPRRRARGRCSPCR